MFLKYCKVFLFFVLCINAPLTAQSSNNEQREEYEKKMQEELDRQVNDFVPTLDADDFQKEIIKQKIHSYFAERKKIYYDATLKPFEKDELLSTLADRHFMDIKNMMPDDTYEKVKSFLKDGGTELKKQRKKDKRKKD